MSACVYLLVCVCVYIRTCVHRCACNVCACICMYMCMHTYMCRCRYVFLSMRVAINPVGTRPRACYTQKPKSTTPTKQYSIALWDTAGLKKQPKQPSLQSIDTFNPFLADTRPPNMRARATRPTACAT